MENKLQRGFQVSGSYLSIQYEHVIYLGKLSLKIALMYMSRRLFVLFVHLGYAYVEIRRNGTWVTRA